MLRKRVRPSEMAIETEMYCSTAVYIYLFTLKSVLCRYIHVNIDVKMCRPL